MIGDIVGYMIHMKLMGCMSVEKRLRRRRNASNGGKRCSPDRVRQGSPIGPATDRRSRAGCDFVASPDGFGPSRPIGWRTELRLGRPLPIGPATMQSKSEAMSLQMASGHHARSGPGAVSFLA